MLLAPASVAAAEKRCNAQGEKVECPVQSEEALARAQEAYEQEAIDMMEGKAGSTYGVAPFDYLTGVGKRTDETTLTEGDSGYGGATGRTELWDRVNQPSEGEAVYNQWTHNWSPSFGETLVAGADPNEGKQWYYVYCITCHGWLLQGDGPSAIHVDPRPRILTAGSYMNRKTNLELFTVIKGGGEAVDLSASMPAWGNFLQDQDIWNVVAWVRAMADVGVPTTIEEYLNPQSSFQPNADAVTPLNAADNEDFQDTQELVEAVLAGRGTEALSGGGFVEGGLRKPAESVAEKVDQAY
jgi:cytochrome c oxidase cbb3-type subunit 3